MNQNLDPSTPADAAFPNRIPVSREAIAAYVADSIAVKQAVLSDAALLDAIGAVVRLCIDTFRRGGKILVPSFAVGRTQELVYALHELAHAYHDQVLGFNDAEVIKAYGYGPMPDLTRGRREVRRLSGSSWVPLLVTDDDGVAGMFTERDYARKVILHGKASSTTAVREIMTTPVVTAGPLDTVRPSAVLIACLGAGAAAAGAEVAPGAAGSGAVPAGRVAPPVRALAGVPSNGRPSASYL